MSTSSSILSRADPTVGEPHEPDPAVVLESYAAALADGVAEALPSWVVSSVAKVMSAWAGHTPPDVTEAAEAAASRAVREIVPAIRDLLRADVDEQRTTPLELVRSALRYPTEVLRAAGVAPVERDAFAEAAFPDDVYNLAPASFADLDPTLGEAALRWGAAKAFEHKRRHR